MSQYPPPFSNHPQSPYTVPYAVPLRPTRPGGVVAIGVVGLILGAVCGLATANSTLNLVRDTPVADMLKKEPGVYAVSLAVGMAGIALQVVLIAGSVGLLMMQRWGRALVIAFALGMIVQVAADLIVAVGWVLPLVNRLLASHGVARGPREQAQVVGTLVGASLRGVFPIVALLVLMKPEIKRAFNSQG